MKRIYTLLAITLICTSVYAQEIAVMTISQEHIFNAQKTKFVRPSESVSILNSFPIFLYDYFK